VKLVLITAHFPPHFTGGGELVALTEARELARLGHDVRVVSGTDRAHCGGDIEREVVSGIRVAFLPRHPGEQYDLELARPRIEELLRAETADADLVHVHHWSTLSTRIVRTLAPTCPVVVSLHDAFVACPRFFRLKPGASEACGPEVSADTCATCIAPELGTRSGGSRITHRSAELVAELDAAAELLAPSQAHAERVAAWTGRRARVLAPGLCHELARASNPIWTGADPLRILHAGRRSEAKGTLDLVLALATLPRGSAVLVAPGGADPAFDEVLYAACGGLEMELSGTYESEALARTAATCHLAAFPSRLPESYSLVVDEAVASGLPTWVASGSPALERYDEPVVRALPAGDPVAWAHAFGELLACPDALRVAHAALPSSVRGAGESARDIERIFSRLCSALT
jgi:glycosyltransferase involved in cell wall biosynthesis